MELSAVRVASLGFPCGVFRFVAISRGVCPLSLPSPRRGEGITVSFGAEVRRCGFVGCWVALSA
jgi:hypothetical protein